MEGQPLQLRELEDQAAVVVGAGQPIADAVARRFAAAGARLALCHLADDTDAAQALASELGGVPCYECDPADPASVRTTMRRAVKELGGLELLANLTVYRNRLGKLLSHEVELSDWCRLQDVLLGGTVYFCREAIRVMMRKKRGRILNLVDQASQAGKVARGDYAAARGGIAALTRALSGEIGPLGIRINAVSASYLDNELGLLTEEGRQGLLDATPLRRAGTVEEVADAALVLCSESTRFTTGHVLQVNGGLAL